MIIVPFAAKMALGVDVLEWLHKRKMTRMQGDRQLAKTEAVFIPASLCIAAPWTCALPRSCLMCWLRRYVLTRCKLTSGSPGLSSPAGTKTSNSNTRTFPPSPGWPVQASLQINCESLRQERRNKNFFLFFQRYWGQSCSSVISEFKEGKKGK